MGFENPLPVQFNVGLKSMDFLICENIRDKGLDPLSYRINFNTYSVNRKLLCFTEILA